MLFEEKVSVDSNIWRMISRPRVAVFLQRVVYLGHLVSPLGTLVIPPGVSRPQGEFSFFSYNKFLMDRLTQQVSNGSSDHLHDPLPDP